MKPYNRKEYQIEREYLGKITTREMVENIIEKHMERIGEGTELKSRKD